MDPAQPGGKQPGFLAKLPRELGGAEQVRYRERTMVERVHARPKDEFGGHTRGSACFGL